MNSGLSVSATSLGLSTNGTTTVSALGGVPLYVYNLAAGSGNINSLTGLFTATATPGSGTIQTTDSVGSTGGIQISFSDLNHAIYPQNQTMVINSTLALVASGGIGPYNYNIVSGKGTISNSGLYSSFADSGDVVVEVTDTLGSVSTANITVTAGLVISSSVQTIAVGESITFQAVGGKSPYTYSLVSGDRVE